MSKDQHIKAKSYHPNMNARQKAQADRKKSKRFVSPDVTKKHIATIEVLRLDLFSDTKEELKIMVTEQLSKYKLNESNVVYK